jgi:hypothetical protein
MQMGQKAAEIIKQEPDIAKFSSLTELKEITLENGQLKATKELAEGVTEYGSSQLEG